jgi:predicted MFS family arabinose efflux permease
LAAYAWNLELLMLCRFLSGLGYGGVLAASAGLVVQTTDKDHRTRGFAAWGAGFAAASICAVVLGGTLVTHIGYRNGMIVSAFISIILGAFILLFHPRKPPVITDLAKIKNRVSDLFAVFRDRNALLTLLFASLPVQLAFFGLFQFTLPLVMHQSGISDANIGRILTIYGLFSLAAPVLARFADRTKRERLLISIGNLITGLVLTLFFFQHSTLAMIFVVAAIGIGGLMFDTCISAYLTMTGGAAALGDTKFLSVFLTWEKLFTIFIPVIVGTMMTAFGYLESAAVLGIVIFVGSVIFLLFTRTPRLEAGENSEIP